MSQDPEQKVLCVIAKLLEEYELCPEGTRELEVSFDILKSSCNLWGYQLENILNKLKQEKLIEEFIEPDTI